MTRTISRDTYLKALGLSTLAAHHYKICREVQLTNDAMLGLEDGSHVDDAIYSAEFSAQAFDEALRRENVTVEPETALAAPPHQPGGGSE